jgi:hypothetical protein
MPSIVKDVPAIYQDPIFACPEDGGTDRDMVAPGHALYG